MNKKLYCLCGKEVKPCDDLVEWAYGIADSNCKIGKTRIGKYLVSTVFVGWDYNYSGIGSPILFETMVLDRENRGLYQTRETDYEYAVDAHQVVCRYVMQGVFDQTILDF